MGNGSKIRHHRELEPLYIQVPCRVRSSDQIRNSQYFYEGTSSLILSEARGENRGASGLRGRGEFALRFFKRNLAPVACGELTDLDTQLLNFQQRDQNA